MDQHPQLVILSESQQIYSSAMLGFFKASEVAKEDDLFKTNKCHVAVCERENRTFIGNARPGLDSHVKKNPRQFFGKIWSLRLTDHEVRKRFFDSFYSTGPSISFSLPETV